MIVVSIQEAVGTGGVMIEDHDIGTVGGIGSGIGIVGYGIDIPAVVGVDLGEVERLIVFAPQSAQFVIEVAVRLAEHVGIFGDALYSKKGRARL